MIRSEADRVIKHFAGNDRVAFREVFPFEEEPETPEVTVYVNGEMLPGSGMILTGSPCHEKDIANIIASIESGLGLDRAPLEVELRGLISSIATRDLKTLIRMAKDFLPRQTLDARYSVDAEGANADETWTLEQIIESNPDTFEDEDIEKLHRLAVGQSLQFQGGAWATFTIRREA